MLVVIIVFEDLNGLFFLFSWINAKKHFGLNINPKNTSVSNRENKNVIVYSSVTYQYSKHNFIITHFIKYWHPALKGIYM